MIWMKWTDDLQQAKIDVGFETLKSNPNEGVKLLYDSACNSQEVFVKKLAKDNGFIEQLESLLGQKDVKENPILEMLNIYYGSD